MNTIDLRSDTVTLPTTAMQQAMQEVPLGDDVYGEDPTVNQLQDFAAELTGFEAALFVPSGSMGNQVAVATHVGRGSEVILPYGAHIYEYEPGALAVISGALPRLIPAPLGIPEVADIASQIRNNIHQAPTELICLENTHNKAGGTVVPLERTREIAELAKANNLPFHLDGARICNATAALNISLEEISKPFDTMSLCLSKGLAAPVGSVILGSKEFITKAHRYRKMLGGGMRQAGILAAAGIIALRDMRERMVEDHERASELAKGLAGIEGIFINMKTVQTNMVYFNIDNASEIVDAMKTRGILCNALTSDSIRLVTHYHITDDDIEKTVQVIEDVIERRTVARAAA